jgi:hypothetical protein
MVIVSVMEIGIPYWCKNISQKSLRGAGNLSYVCHCQGHLDMDNEWRKYTGEVALVCIHSNKKSFFYNIGRYFVVLN